MKISKPTNHKWSIPGEGGKWPNANFEYQTTKWKYPNLPTTNDQFWGGGGVNYQMQIVIKLPNGTIKVAQNDSEQQILPNSHFSNLYQL